MENFCLTTQRVATLKVLHKAQRDRRLARIKSIVLLGTGWSVAEVAQALLVDESTVRLWYEKYQQKGTELTSWQCVGAHCYGMWMEYTHPV